MSENMHGRPAPFDEYINYSLDMSGVDGISFETVALAMREIMHNAAFDDGDLDRLQATLRDCLSVEIIHHLIQRDPGVTDIDPELVDRMVMTSMLLAFSSYNRLTEQFGFEAPALAQSRDDVQRLWRTLRAASGWINKAADRAAVQRTLEANDLKGDGAGEGRYRQRELAPYAVHRGHQHPERRVRSGEAGGEAEAPDRCGEIAVIPPRAELAASRDQRLLQPVIPRVGEGACETELKEVSQCGQLPEGTKCSHAQNVSGQLNSESARREKGSRTEPACMRKIPVRPPTLKMMRLRSETFVLRIQKNGRPRVFQLIDNGHIRSPLLQVEIGVSRIEVLQSAELLKEIHGTKTVCGYIQVPERRPQFRQRTHIDFSPIETDF